MYVLRRTSDGRFVADMSKSRDGQSYTRDLLQARIFGTKEQADRDRCRGNEVAVRVESLLRGG